MKILFLSLRRKKKKRQQEVKDEKPYIKKPPNAFMLFMKEQRPTIEPELWKQGSGVVNAILGKRVNAFPYLSHNIVHICMLFLKGEQSSSWLMVVKQCINFSYFIFRLVSHLCREGTHHDCHYQNATWFLGAEVGRSEKVQPLQPLQDTATCNALEPVKLLHWHILAPKRRYEMAIQNKKTTLYLGLQRETRKR